MLYVGTNELPSRKQVNSCATEFFVLLCPYRESGGAQKYEKRPRGASDLQHGISEPYFADSLLIIQF